MGPGVAALPHCRLPGTESSGREVSPLLSATGLSLTPVGAHLHPRGYAGPPPGRPQELLRGAGWGDAGCLSHLILGALDSQVDLPRALMR